MQFVQLPVEEAIQAYLAHSCRLNGKRLAKGTRIDATLATALAAAGVSQVTVARLEKGDVHEDEAASTLSEAMAGVGIRLSRARTGRVNVHACAEGLYRFDRDRMLALNAIDERITCATLDENHWVTPGRMLATIKIIPYAVPRSILDQALDLFRQPLQRLTVREARPKRVALLQTRLSAVRESVLDKTFEVTRQRLSQRGSLLLLERRCAHDVDSLCTSITDALSHHPDYLMIIGASAISDRADVVPQALVAAGGELRRFGIPVDPGNLLLLGCVGDTTVLGAPGCARSPKDNGLDRLLDRLSCDLPIEDSWLDSLAIGGLLDEDAARPSPRQEASPVPSDNALPAIGALLLAAGPSPGKSTLRDKEQAVGHFLSVPLVHRIASQLLEVQCDEVVVVTGHDSDLMQKALSSLPVKTFFNPHWESGLGHSIAAGVSRLLDCDAILVCHGNMPPVRTQTLLELLAAFRTNRHRRILTPCHQNQRGNPVLFSSVFFDALMALTGDSGARFLINCYPEFVHEVAVSDPGVLLVSA